MLGLNLVISLIITMMLLGTGMMYPNNTLNLLLYGLFALLFILAFWAMRDRRLWTIGSFAGHISHHSRNDPDVQPSLEEIRSLLQAQRTS